MQLKFAFIVACCLFTLFGANVNCEDDQDDCPNEKDIDPCQCDRQGLACYSLKDDDDLLRVFSFKNKYNAYRSIWIIATPLKKLKANAFGGVRINNIFIEGNQLAEIENGAFQGIYDYVRTLSLYDNQLEVIPVKEIKKMKYLEKLILKNNKIKVIPANFLKGLNMLADLSLEYNQIEELPDDAFRGAKSLRMILMDDNKLTKIGGKTFKGLVSGIFATRLTISLSNNQIEEIEEDAFEGGSIDTLALDGNKLQYFDKRVFAPIVKKTAIIVGDNPFTCSGCSQYSWMLNLKSHRILGFTCEDGRTIDDLTAFNIGCA